VIPNALSTPSSLVTLLERDIESAGAGICFDFGHAFLGGDVPDAIETVAEHLIATHVHDNHRRADEHLVPYHGAINWDAALISMQKIGYDGTYLMELANTDTPAAVLEDARRARERFERAMLTQ
jgi:L-ribulose-5-phosphate 3-epimerase